MTPPLTPPVSQPLAHSAAERPPCALYAVGQNSTQYGLLLAGATVVLIPVLVVFLVFQRRVIEGIATTGIK